VQWGAGEAGERALKLRVAAAPRAGRITARVVDAEGGAVVPLPDGEASVVVLSPVISFVPTQQVGGPGPWVLQPRVFFAPLPAACLSTAPAACRLRAPRPKS
jgi:hypothetical protein